MTESNAPTNTSPGSPASGIDYPSLLRRCMGKRELAGRLVRVFLDESARDLKELEAALHEQDAARLTAIAHRLKGAAGNVSAEAVRETAAQLEELGRVGDLTLAAEAFVRLRAKAEALGRTEPPATV